MLAPTWNGRPTSAGAIVSSATITGAIWTATARGVPLVPPSIEDTSYWYLRGGWLTTYELSGAASVSGGVDIDHEDGSNISTFFLPPFFGGNASGDYALSRTTPGTFVEATASAGDLSVEVGLRADFPEEKDTAWSPRFGARYALGGSGTALRGTVSRAFKLPSFFALASPPQLGGNPELRPETSVGIDFGVDQRVDAWDMTASFTVFWIRYEDLIDFDFDLFQNVNRDEVNSKGFEVSLRWNPDPRVAVLADLTYQDTESPDTDQPLAQPAGLDWQRQGGLQTRGASAGSRGIELGFRELRRADRRTGHDDGRRIRPARSGCDLGSEPRLADPGARRQSHRHRLRAFQRLSAARHHRQDRPPLRAALE